MIPSNSYPEAPAKVRVINLQDQLKLTVNTVHEAGTIHVALSEELIPADFTTPKKELPTTDNLPIPPLASFYTARILDQADTGDIAKPTCTGPFIEFGQDGPAACGGS